MTPVKFLLLTDPRSGTMMLTDSLSAAYPSRLKWFNYYAVNPNNTVGHFTNWQAHLYTPPNNDTTYTGTTMHRVGDAWISALSPLRLDGFWLVMRGCHERWILLRRDNELRRYLSKLVGIVLRSYRVDSPRALDPGPVRIVVQELLEFIEASRQLQERIDSQFPGALKLTYRQLADDWSRTFAAVQEYLELPPVSIAPVTHRQEARPLSEAIENYDEVRSYLCNRGYERWFDED